MNSPITSTARRIARVASAHSSAYSVLAFDARGELIDWRIGDPGSPWQQGGDCDRVYCVPGGTHGHRAVQTLMDEQDSRRAQDADVAEMERSGELDRINAVDVDHLSRADARLDESSR